MAASINKVILLGNLTKDPEPRKTQSGKDVCSFSIATNKSWKDSSGQKQEEVEYHNVTAWGKLSEICVQYLKKGQKIYAEGSLKTRNWEGTDGTKHTRTEIVLDEMVMCGSKGSQQVQEQATVSTQPVYPEPENDEIRLEDIPF